MRALVLAGGPAEPGPDGYPALLAEANGVTLLERLLGNLALAGARAVVFAVRESDARRFALDAVIAQASPLSACARVPDGTAGAACTALFTIGQFSAEEELLILNANEEIDLDFATLVAEFRERALDAGLVAFPSLHPRYSYVRLDEAELVVEAAEKRPISRQAIAGLAWWRRAGDFFASVQAMIRKDAHVGGTFYISPALNELVLQGGRIGVHRISAAQYRPLKSARQLARFEEAAA